MRNNTDSTSLREARRRENFKQQQLADAVGVDRATISRAEAVGDPMRRGQRRASHKDMIRWWKAYKEICKENCRPPTISLKAILNLWEMSRQRWRFQSAGLPVTCLQYWGDTTLNSLILSGLKRVCREMHMDCDATSAACVGDVETFIQHFKAAIAQGRNFLVDMPPDRRACNRVYELLLQAVKARPSSVTILGLSPYHEGLAGVRDDPVEIARLIAARLGRIEHPKVKVLSIIGGAAHLSYHRNDALGAVLTKQIKAGRYEFLTHHVQFSQPRRISATIKCNRPKEKNDPPLVLVPLHFCASELLAQRAGEFGPGVHLITTEIDQSWIRKMRRWPDQWLATVTTDPLLMSTSAVALMEFRNRDNHSESTSDKLDVREVVVPATLIESSKLGGITTMDNLRQRFFAATIRSFISENPWMEYLLDFLSASTFDGQGITGEASNEKADEFKLEHKSK